MAYVYLALAILTEVVGTAALKASNGFTNLWPSLIVVVGYGLAFFFFSLVLKSIPMGIAYAIWSALGIVLMLIVGLVLFQQKPDLAAIVGTALIISGVVVIQVFSTTAQHGA